MKIITQTFIASIALLILASASFAQAKSITGDEYYAPIHKAYSKMSELIRKKVQIYKSYTNGKFTAISTDTTEYLPPDKSRWIHIKEEKGKIVERFEQIDTGNSSYRKEDNGVWRKLGYGDPITGPGGLGDSTREFFVEEAKIGKEKFQVLTRKTVNSDKTYFEVEKTWINKDGLITKETSTTSLKELKNVDSTDEVTYDYKIKPPKIEPPIK